MLRLDTKISFEVLLVLSLLEISILSSFVWVPILTVLGHSASSMNHGPFYLLVSNSVCTLIKGLLFPT